MSNSIFGNLKTDGLEETGDRLGGYEPLPSGIYTGTIKAAYTTTSASGARSVVVIAALEHGSKTVEYRETFWVTNSKGENWYTRKEDEKKKIPLPGFVHANDICIVTTEKELHEQEIEPRVMKIYDADARREVDKSVPALVELVGRPVALAILHQLEDKTKKDEQTNTYVPTGETRETNVTDKVFEPSTMLTVAEARNGAGEASFFKAWSERNKGQVRDRRKGTNGHNGQAGAPGMTAQATRAAVAGPPTASATPAPRKSLFGAKA